MPLIPLNPTHWTVKVLILKCHNDISVHVNLYGYYLTSLSLCSKPKTSHRRFSSWITVQQLQIRSTQTPLWVIVWSQVHRGPCFWRVMKIAPHMNPPKTAKQGTFGDDSPESEIFWIYPLSQSLPQTSLNTCNRMKWVCRIKCKHTLYERAHEVTEQSLADSKLTCRTRRRGAATLDLGSMWSLLTAGKRLTEWVGLS